MGECIFAAKTEFDRPVFAKLFADGDIRRSDVLVIAESIMIRGSHAAIPCRVGRHVVVGRRERILDSGFDHAGLPELGLKIHFGGVDIDNLLALDINPERIDTTERLVVVRLLKIDGRVIIAVVVDIDRQLALKGFGEGVGIVEVRRVLRSFKTVLRIGRTVRRVCALDHVGGVTSGHNMLVHVHERHLKDEAECIERVDIPIVTDLEHVILEIHGIIRIGVVLQRRRFAVRLKINVVLRKDLGELSESVRLLAAVIEHEREHFLIQPTFDIAEIHAASHNRQKACR